MNYFNRQPEGLDDLSPRKCVIIAGVATLLFGFMMSRCEPDPVIAAEKSYNDQRYAKRLKEQQDAAIANSLRRTAKAKAQRFLTAEDEAIEGFWPGQGRKR